MTDSPIDLFDMWELFLSLFFLLWNYSALQILGHYPIRYPGIQRSLWMHPVLSVPISHVSDNLCAAFVPDRLF